MIVRFTYSIARMLHNAFKHTFMRKLSHIHSHKQTHTHTRACDVFVADATTAVDPTHVRNKYFRRGRDSVLKTSNSEIHSHTRTHAHTNREYFLFVYVSVSVCVCARLRARVSVRGE